MSIGPGDQPIEDVRVHKRLHIFFRIARLLPQQFRNRARPWPSIALVLACGMKAERLTHILLMDTRPPPSASHTVISLHYNRDLVAEVLNTGVGNDQPGRPGQAEREVLVLRVTIPFTRRRFENMRSGNTARWNAPPFALEEKSGLGLSTGEAELSRVLSTAPCRMIRSQRTQPLGNFILS